MFVTMQNTMKFELFENDIVVDTIHNEINTNPCCLATAIEDFRKKVNDAFNKRIKDEEHVDDYMEDDFSSEEEESVENIKKKRRCD